MQSEVYDVTGAGDTVISVFTLARAAGATWEEAAKIANTAGGVVVGKSWNIYNKHNRTLRNL